MRTFRHTYAISHVEKKTIKNISNFQFAFSRAGKKQNDSDFQFAFDPGRKKAKRPDFQFAFSRPGKKQNGSDFEFTFFQAGKKKQNSSNFHFAFSRAGKKNKIIQISNLLFPGPEKSKMYQAYNLESGLETSSTC